MSLNDSVSLRDSGYGDSSNGGALRGARQPLPSPAHSANRRLEERTFPFCLLPAHYFDRASAAGQQAPSTRSIAMRSTSNEPQSSCGPGGRETESCRPESIEFAGLIVERW
jgi:hypothetical protein